MQLPEGTCPLQLLTTRTESPQKCISGCLLQWGKMPLEYAQFYAAEIVETLEYIHAQGIVHRDLKVRVFLPSLHIVHGFISLQEMPFNLTTG